MNHLTLNYCYYDNTFMTKYNETWIIDDDKVYIYGLMRTMKRLGFSEKIKTYHDGKQAFNELAKTDKSNTPDIILLDLNMPVWDGWDFLEFSKSLKFSKKIHLFVVSSSIMQEDIDRAKEYEKVTDYYVKPITTKQLLAMMEESK